VNEERRVNVIFDQVPQDYHLGEQAEVYITTVHLPRALLVAEAAIIGLGEGRGTVWTVEDGHLQQREVTLGHRLLDGRYEIVGGVAEKAMVVAHLRSGLRADRAVTIAGEPNR
jgi:HlyD family secretion protein